MFLGFLRRVRFLGRVAFVAFDAFVAFEGGVDQKVDQFYVGLIPIATLTMISIHRYSHQCKKTGIGSPTKRAHNPWTPIPVENDCGVVSHFFLRPVVSFFCRLPRHPKRVHDGSIDRYA